MKVVPMSVALIDHMGSELSVVNAARVSFNKKSEWEWKVLSKDDPDFDPNFPNDSAPILSDKDAKLIRYLAKYKHFSPFNHTFITTRVKAPIFVARQLVKHKFMPWNEVSRRYVDDEPEFYLPEVWRGKPVNAKQGSDGVVELSNNWRGEYPDDMTELALLTYRLLLQDGVAPEQARMVLPQNTMTEWYWSGTLGAYADMLRLRLDPHAQQESQEIAKLVYNLILPLFPVSLPALLNTHG